MAESGSAVLKYSFKGDSNGRRKSDKNRVQRIGFNLPRISGGNRRNGEHDQNERNARTNNATTTQSGGIVGRKRQVKRAFNKNGSIPSLAKILYGVGEKYLLRPKKSFNSAFPLAFSIPNMLKSLSLVFLIDQNTQKGHTMTTITISQAALNGFNLSANAEIARILLGGKDTGNGRESYQANVQRAWHYAEGISGTFGRKRRNSQQSVSGRTEQTGRPRYRTSTGSENAQRTIARPRGVKSSLKTAYNVILQQFSHKNHKKYCYSLDKLIKFTYNLPLKAVKITANSQNKGQK
jgi:hypothetical protein